MNECTIIDLVNKVGEEVLTTWRNSKVRRQNLDAALARHRSMHAFSNQ